MFGLFFYGGALALFDAVEEGLVGGGAAAVVESVGGI